MRFLAAALFFFGAAVSYSQTPEVPHKLQFAGMTLTIKDDARREIQKDVDALTKSPYYFNIKVERAKTYFPIIEKVFQEERLPEDFKYLALQESALIADAVSSSDAVGYWQFKDFTAEEMGMRVDKEIDERMNIVSASRGAAKYLKQNNNYFNNWVYALQAYQMGAGGAMRAVGDKHNGAKHMDIDKHTYWYVKKYLAHKIAFENALSGEPKMKMSPVVVNRKATLDEIASQYSVSKDLLAENNKWARKGVIPGDKNYTVLIPGGDFTSTAIMVADKSSDKGGYVPKVNAPIASFATINKVPVIMANPGDQLTTLADKAGIKLSAFLRYNEITIDHKIIPGHSYFIEKKKKKSSEPYHKIADGETLWAISQQHGVQLKKIKKYNRLSSDYKMSPNSMLWLAGMKPPKESTPEEGIIELDNDSEFNWGQKNSILVTASASAKMMTANSDYMPENIPVEVVDQGTIGKSQDSSLSNATIIHIVKDTDTLYGISRQYGVTIQQLMDWNGKQDFSISMGEKLRILKP